MVATTLLCFSLHPSLQTLKSPFLSHTPLPHYKFPAPRISPIKLSHKSSNSKPIITMSSYQPVPVTERLISACAYFLPFFNGLQYGRYLFMKYPSLGLLIEPIFPLLKAYRSVTYASFVAFFMLYLWVVRNPSFSKYVRFNSMQAVVLDALLALPLLFQRIFSPGKGLGLQLLVFRWFNVLQQ